MAEIDSSTILSPGVLISTGNREGFYLVKSFFAEARAWVLAWSLSTTACVDLLNEDADRAKVVRARLRFLEVTSVI